MEKKLKIGIIGSGIGGLSAAVKLAGFGYDVSVFEKNSIPGGKAGLIEEKGFRFDTGPSLLTMPFVLEKLFKECNENINDYLTIAPLKILCKYFYPDGIEINAFNKIEQFAEEVENKTIDKKETVKQYFEYCKTIYDLTSDMFLFKSFSDPLTFLNLKALKTLFQINKIDSFRSMHEANLKFFKDTKTIQLFDRYATYNGSNPYKAPATLNIIQHVEYALGGFIVEEGIYQIPNALHNLALKKGVKFFFNHRVKNIITNNKKVKGLLVENDNGKEIENYFDVVVSNSDVNFTYTNLLNDESSKESIKYKNLEPSSSAIVFYWGVKENHSKLDTHNILFSKNYENEFDELFNKKICPDDPTVYIYISSKFKKNDAPEEHENWFVMINAPFIINQTWDDEINKTRKNILNKINDILNIDISNKIVFEKTLSPIEIEKNTNSFKGSIYGISSNTRNAAFLRQQNKSKDYEGLYFCGGSAHPGGGIPLVVSSGQITADLIFKKYNSK